MKLRRTLLTTAVTAATLLAVAPVASAQTSTKPAVVRDGAQWLLRDSLSGGAATESFFYGTAGDVKLLCDFNGDGVATPAVVRQADGNLHWLLRDSRSGGAADHHFIYGRDGDIPVCGDWDGNGSKTPGIVRQRDNGGYEWHLRNSLSGGVAHVSFPYGRDLTPGDMPPTWPIVGDWNGDGVDTPGIVRGHDEGQMEWLLRDSNSGGNATTSFYYYDGGVWGDDSELHRPIVGDWNGDGHDSPGVIASSDGETPRWLLRDDRSAGTADHVFRYGSAIDIALTWE